MRGKTRKVLAVLGGLSLLAAWSAPLLAQDDEEAPSRGRIYVEAGAWNSKPVGIEDEPATRVDPFNPLSSELIRFQHDDNAGGYFRAGYEMHKNLGNFIFTYYSTDEELSMQEFTPGTFQFGEILPHPFLAGYENDGIADGFESNSSNSLSDFRFDFSRTAFRSDRVVGTWFVGVRRVKFKRALDATYPALSPVFPPLIPPTSPPRPDLEPLPDAASLSSEYTGRGPEGGMDFVVPLVKNKRLWVEAGFALAVLNGKIETDYQARNFYYLFTDPNTNEQEILAPPYDFTATVDNMGMPAIVADFTTQESVAFGLMNQSRRTTSPVVELYAGLRWRVYKALELFAGFRNVTYGDVAVELRPKNSSLTEVGANFQDVTEVDRSAQYQGVYLGLSYRF